MKLVCDLHLEMDEELVQVMMQEMHLSSYTEVVGAVKGIYSAELDNQIKMFGDQIRYNYKVRMEEDDGFKPQTGPNSYLN